MKPWMILATAALPDGSELVLSQRDTELVVRVNGHELMSSRRHGSEEAMAAAVAPAIARRRARVLIGGLGFGYTLRAALDRLGPGGHVEVVEISRDMLEWNARFLGHLNARALDDPRVTVVCADLAQVLAAHSAVHVAGRADDRGYDAILVDVDNGPWPLAVSSNRSLWQRSGILALTRALRTGGALVVWSTGPDPAFEARLRAAGLAVELQQVRAHSARGSRHTLFVAQWRGEP